MTRAESKMLGFVCEQLVKQHAVAAGGLVDFKLYTPIYDVQFMRQLHICVCEAPAMTVYAAEEE